MIGRGTRLSSDIFGLGHDKQEFYIFDTCGNFEFFDLNPKGVKTANDKSITQQIFESRLQLSQLLAQTGKEENLEISKAHLDALHKQVQSLDHQRFVVQMNLRYVDIFSERSKWNNLSNDDKHLIEEHISGLPVPEPVHELTRRFDLLMLKMQIANLLSLAKEAAYADNLKEIAEKLSGKYTIPEVLNRRVLLEEMKTDFFYVNISQKKLEQVREEIRELLKFLDPAERKPVFSDLIDEDLVLQDGLIKYGGSRESYRKRVERFIRENKDHLTIRKFHTNHPITEAEISALERILFDGDSRGTKDDFVKNLGEQPLGKFIRSIVGLDTLAARQAFSEFLNSGNFTADQIKFLDTIISYLTKNGTIDKAMLVEPPFNDMHDQGIFGVFEDEGQVFKVISIIDGINGNAERVG
ncbi:hypothetical protein BH23BAC2_BH23BAC2_22410 [soil metagenome]